MSIFDLPHFDLDVVAKLRSLRSHREGSLLGMRHAEKGENAPDDKARSRIVDQTTFILSAFDAVRPKLILEIGTHRAEFCYLAMLWDSDVRVVTIEVRGDRKPVDFLNGMFGDRIEQYIGASQKVLPGLIFIENPGLAWIDGSHKKHDAQKDMINCARHNISHLLIDDASNPNVAKAIKMFCGTGSYMVLRSLMGSRPIVHIKSQPT